MNLGLKNAAGHYTILLTFFVGVNFQNKQLKK